MIPPLGFGYRPAWCRTCGEKPAVMWTPGLITRGYYCADHIPVGFNGVIPEENKIENEPMKDMLPLVTHE
jgi:hypothetical protein